MGNNNSKNKIYPISWNKKNIIGDETCSICLNLFNDDNITLPCKHNFHESCIIKWLDTKNNCPLCRSNMIYKKVND